LSSFVSASGEILGAKINIKITNVIGDVYSVWIKTLAFCSSTSRPEILIINGNYLGITSLEIKGTF
jgi:hypothetical protein